MSETMTSAAAAAGGGAVRTVGGEAFRAFASQAEGRVAVEFMSYGCGHCRTIEPMVQRVAEDLLGEETVLRVNIAAEPELASRYGVTATPTFIMFSNGSEVGRVEGPSPTLEAVREALIRPFRS